MMKMVNQGSTLINRIYQRWTPDDVRQFAAKLPALTASSAKKQNPPKKRKAPS